jgi:hypothetical protein
MTKSAAQSRGQILAITFIVLLSFLLSGLAVADQAPAATLGAKRPVKELLRADGTLDLSTGFSGTLDPAGFRLVTGNGGAPRFVAAGAQAAAMACDPDAAWGDEFSGPGPDGPIEAIAVIGSDVYIGGDFTYINDLAVNRVAKWNGTGWSMLGTGMNYSVHALAVSGTDLYAGGHFTTAGGTSANRVAKWNGTSWAAKRAARR